MNEQDLRERYKQAAAEVLAVAHKLDALKRDYDWLVSQKLGGVAPDWDGSVQVLETLRASMQTTNITAISNLAYYTAE